MRLRPSMRRVAVAVAAVAILSEGWVVPLTTLPYPARGRLEDRAVADWLRTRPPGAVLHLPTRGNDFQEMSYQYATLFQGHPIVNGYSGYDSPLQALLRNASGPMFDFERGEFPGGAPPPAPTPSCPANRTRRKRDRAPPGNCRWCVR